MSNPYFHAKSSVTKWGGVPEDTLAIHNWFDQSKDSFADFRHRALRHHAEGIAECIRQFGPTLTLSTGRVIPTRFVGEQHVKEDLGRIPTVADWLRCIKPETWMRQPKDLPEEQYPNPNEPTETNQNDN